MRKRLQIAAILAAMTVPVWADVAPFPAWRVVTNGTIVGVAQSGDAMYLGGPFTKIGRGVTPFEGFLDLASLGLTTDPGCARDGDSVLGTADGPAEQLIRAAHGPLDTPRFRDGAGPFAVADDVSHVRVSPDCRWDRRFAMRLPPGAVLWGPAIRVGDRVYSGAVATPSLTQFYVVAFDARTGDTVQAWPGPGNLNVVGAAAGGLVAVSYGGNGARALGFFNPVDGSVTQVRSIPVPSSSGVIPLPGRALVYWSTAESGRVTTNADLFDLETWQPLPAWSRLTAGAFEPILASTGAGRLIVSGRDVQVGGGAAHAIAAFDLATGVHDASWSAPSWLDDAGTTISRLVVAGPRLVVQGDFVPGAPRDTIAALDLATGALDPWDFPYAVTSAAPAGAVAYLGNIMAARRVARRNLAAVNALTGDPLPWDPGSLVPASELAVSALAADGVFVYAAGAGRVRRYDVSSGVMDPSWRLDVQTTSGAPASVSRMAVDGDTLYAVGTVDRARGQDSDAYQERHGGAAVRLSGSLAPWDPGLQSTCPAGTRPPISLPCIDDVVVSADRVFLRGTLRFITGSTEVRFLAAVTKDSGAADLTIPSVPTFGMTSADGVFYANLSLASGPAVARVDPGLRVTVLPVAQLASRLAARNDRLYVGAELEAATGTPTGNPWLWLAPVAVDLGIVDAFQRQLSFHADMTATAPGTPTDLTHAVNGTSVRFRWNRAATDLQPLVPPPPGGGTAATTHVITASATPGGPAIAQLDTASAGTGFEVNAPLGTFYVRVQARNAFGISAPSNEVRVDVAAAAPNPPVATVATATGNSVRIQWQASAEGWATASYVLEAGSRPGAADLAVVAVNGLEFRAAGVPPGRYYVRVRAVNANGISAAGQEVLVEVS